MEIEKLLDALKKARENTKKRNFEQSVDFSVVLRDFDLKNQENKIDEFIVLPFKAKKVVKICAFVDKELTTQAREVFDKVIAKDDFAQWRGRKNDIKRLMKEYDWFIAQANIMTDIAGVFGKILGTKGRMPSPKSGAIVPTKVDLKLVRAKLEKTLQVTNRKQAKVDAVVGMEGMEDKDIAQNIMAVYQKIMTKLPRTEQQVKASYVKLTMGAPEKVAV